VSLSPKLLPASPRDSSDALSRWMTDVIRYLKPPHVFADNLVICTTGKGLSIAEGTNGRMGTAVLSGGTKVVANTSVTANTRIFLTRSTTGGTPGHLSYTITAGTSFTINSSGGSDTSTVNWLLIEPA